MKNFVYSLTLLLSLYIFNASAQFTGGNGSGYCAAVSATQALNPTLYNDLEINAIIQPANNDTLLIDTPYNIIFTLENKGIYPVFPSDSLFINITYNLNVLTDTFLFLPDTLAVNGAVDITLQNILYFTDSSDMAQLCVTANGTSFAADTVAGNNAYCITIKIKDPTGINDYYSEDILVHYNSDCRCIIVENDNPIDDIMLYNLLGEKIPFEIKSNIHGTAIYPLHLKNQMILITFNLSGVVCSKKILSY